MSMERVMRELATSLDAQLRTTELLTGSPEVIKSVRLGLIEKAFREAQEAEWKAIVEQVNSYDKSPVIDNRTRKVTEDVYNIATRPEPHCVSPREARSYKHSIILGTLHAFAELSKLDAKREFAHGI